MKTRFTAILCILLALMLSVTSLAYTIPTFKDSEGDETDYDEGVFWVEDDEDLYSGLDYYFETFWNEDDDDELTDEFFKEYTVTQTIFSNTDGVSDSTVKKYLTAAEFVKDDSGRYFYHIGVSATKKITQDIDFGIAIFAKYKDDSDIRLLSVSEYTLCENSSGSEHYCDDDEYDLAAGGEIVEFDEELDRCKIFFANDMGTLSLKLDKVRKFNFSYTDDVVTNSVEVANPKAKVEQINFYGRPRFAEKCTVKLDAGTMNYLYEMTDGNKLTLIANVSKSGTFGFNTDHLGTYVMSDIKLNSVDADKADVSVGGTGTVGTVTPSNPHQNPATGARA